jgi:hypothetical protein
MNMTVSMIIWKKLFKDPKNYLMKVYTLRYEWYKTLENQLHSLMNIKINIMIIAQNSKIK